MIKSRHINFLPVFCLPTIRWCSLSIPIPDSIAEAKAGSKWENYYTKYTAFPTKHHQFTTVRKELFFFGWRKKFFSRLSTPSLVQSRRKNAVVLLHFSECENFYSALFFRAFVVYHIIFNILLLPSRWALFLARNFNADFLIPIRIRFLPPTFFPFRVSAIVKTNQDLVALEIWDCHKTWFKCNPQKDNFSSFGVLLKTFRFSSEPSLEVVKSRQHGSKSSLLWCTALLTELSSPREYTNKQRKFYKVSFPLDHLHKSPEPRKFIELSASINIQRSTALQQCSRNSRQLNTSFTAVSL